MKFIYLANVGLQDGWAQSVQIMNMCSAFSKNGLDVTLLVPSRKEGRKALDAFTYYGIEKTFKIKYLPSIDLYPGNPHIIFYWIRFFSFFLSARLYLFWCSYDVLYTREFFFSPFYKNVFLERHSFPEKVSWVHRRIFKKVQGIIVLTSFIKSKMIDVGVLENKIHVAPDGVRIEEFQNSLDVVNAREKLGLPVTKKFFGYIGTLKTMGMEKGVGTAIESLKYLPFGISLYVVGGEKKDIVFYEEYAAREGVSERVVFAGRVPHEDIPLYTSACDVLVAPFPNTTHYAYYMSPLKIFEYMAAYRPIIVTDLPSLREVLTDGVTALFIPPSDPRALALSIERLCADSELAHHIADNAQKDVVEKYTWKSRAGGIVTFITQ